MDPQEHYTVISADTHAGGSHAQYREYLSKDYLEDFDAWRGRYKNPFKDLKDDRRARNWDSEIRWAEQEADGVVAEVIFPNTVPPFFPSFVLFAPPPRPEDYPHRLEGIRAHNRCLADFLAEYPERRAGIGQVFTNDLDDAIADATWIKEHDLRGGVLLPNPGPDVDWLPKMYDKALDPLWAALSDLDIPVHIHGGTGNPNYGRNPIAPLLILTETVFYSQRPLAHMLLSGVFERFPKLKFVITELGCSWVPTLLNQLDTAALNLKAGRTGEMRLPEELNLPMLPSEYFARNCWVGASQPRPADLAAGQTLPPDRFMWGSDYPHEEGTHPFTREHLRQVFAHLDPAETRRYLSENAAALFGFDLEALAPLARLHGPTVAEVAQPLTELPEDANQALIAGAV